MTRDPKGIHGVFVLTRDMTKENVDYWKNQMKAQYESPDEYR